MFLPIYSLNSALGFFLEKKEIPLGLAEGKMGFSIYFYHLSSVYGNPDYKMRAEKLLDEILENIDSVKTTDLKEGLVGIGLGIDYLIKHDFVKGDVNVVLSDIDNIIFKELSYLNYTEKISYHSLIHKLYYLCIRVEKQKQNSENEYLFKELIIQTVNNLYESFPPNLYQESLVYTIDYILPQFLFVLSKIYELDFYNERIIKITEELSYKVLSMLPILHSNKLYLLWGTSNLNKQIRNKDWDKYIATLKDQIDIEYIFSTELQNRNIFFHNGTTSIYYLADTLSEYFSQDEINRIKELTIHHIRTSEVWTLLKKDSYFESHTGLYNGFAGVIFILHKLQS